MFELIQRSLFEQPFALANIHLMHGEKNCLSSTTLYQHCNSATSGDVLRWSIGFTLWQTEH